MKASKLSSSAIRSFERSVQMTTQAQYVQKGKTLRLERWRVVVDQDAPGSWRNYEAKASNGGWPATLPADGTFSP